MRQKAITGFILSRWLPRKKVAVTEASGDRLEVTLSGADQLPLDDVARSLVLRLGPRWHLELDPDAAVDLALDILRTARPLYDDTAKRRAAGDVTKPAREMKTIDRLWRGIRRLAIDEGLRHEQNGNGRDAPTLAMAG